MSVPISMFETQMKMMMEAHERQIKMLMEAHEKQMTLILGYVNQAVPQPVAQPIPQPVPQPVQPVQPVPQPIPQPVQPVPQPIAQPVQQPEQDDENDFMSVSSGGTARFSKKRFIKNEDDAYNVFEWIDTIQLNRNDLSFLFNPKIVNSSKYEGTNYQIFKPTLIFENIMKSVVKNNKTPLRKIGLWCMNKNKLNKDKPIFIMKQKGEWCDANETMLKEVIKYIIDTKITSFFVDIQQNISDTDMFLYWCNTLTELTAYADSQTAKLILILAKSFNWDYFNDMENNPNFSNPIVKKDAQQTKQTQNKPVLDYKTIVEYENKKIELFDEDAKKRFLNVKYTNTNIKPYEEPDEETRRRQAEQVERHLKMMASRFNGNYE